MSTFRFNQILAHPKLVFSKDNFNIIHEQAKKSFEYKYCPKLHNFGYFTFVDYVNIVAHIFMRETREFYNIEALWADGEITNIAD